MPTQNAQLKFNPEAGIIQQKPFKTLLHRCAAEPYKIAFATLDGIQYVSATCIRYCRADDNYCHIMLTNGERILMSRTLKWVAALLPKHQFIRTHASYMVQVNAINRFDAEYVILDCGTRIPVSRSHRMEVRKTLAYAYALHPANC